MSILPNIATVLLLGIAAAESSGQELFHVNEARMTEVAREALRLQVPELADSELPLISILIVCNDTEGMPCTGVVQLATAVDENITREGQHCATDTTYTTVQVALRSNGEALVPESRGTSSKSNISTCSQTSEPEK